jgi:Na+-driven multidrug efflux pump
LAPTLLRLALPNLGEAAARIAFISFDAVFVGWIGTDALAGVSLAFPLFLLMQMTSASGVGAGVNGAVARAMGAGRRDDAAAIAFHAVVLALLVGGTFTVLMVTGGPRLYAAMGATGGGLAAAVTYSGIVFGGVGRGVADEPAGQRRSAAPATCWCRPWPSSSARRCILPCRRY